MKKTRLMIIVFVVVLLGVCIVSILSPPIVFDSSDTFDGTIPKIVHQTYKSESQLPEYFRKSMKSWKNAEGFEYKFWSDSECLAFVKAHYPEFLDLYVQAPTIQKTDIFRYLVIHHFGGIYADMDTELRGDISQLLTRPMLVGVEYDKGTRIFDIQPQYNQWCFGSFRGNPAMYEIVNQVKKRKDKVRSLGTVLSMLGDGRWRFSEHEKVYWLTGPYIFTDVVNAVPKGKVRIEPRGVLGKFGGDIPNVIVHHHFAGSWKKINGGV